MGWPIYIVFGLLIESSPPAQRQNLRLASCICTRSDIQLLPRKRYARSCDASRAFSLQMIITVSTRESAIVLDIWAISFKVSPLIYVPTEVGLESVRKR
ncbi:hypothetical protein Plhal304r1_c006g0026411 [Plasmopara halstedii]